MRVVVWKQTRNQLNIVADLLGCEGTGPLIATRDLRRQCTEGTTRAWIISVRYVQIAVNQLCERYRWPAGCGSVHATLPPAECRADCFGNQIVTRIEVLVEPAYRKTGFLHYLGDSESCESFFAESL